MKSTSAQYLLPLLFAAGVPFACSGSSEKLTDRGERNEAGSDGNDPASGGSKANGAGGEGGTGEVSHAGKGNGGASAGSGGASAGSGGASAGGGGTSQAGAAGSPEGGASPEGGGAGGDSAAGAGGDTSIVVDPPIDPTLDGAGDAASGRYRLRYKPLTKCLVSTPGKVAGASCDNVKAQEFYLDGAGDGSVRVRGVDSGECVSLHGDGIGPVVCNADAGLLLNPVAGNYFQLILPDQRCLGMAGALLAAVTCSADTTWSLDQIGTNYALNAKWTATSTFPGYSVNYAHDGDHNAGLEGHSWANNWNPPGLVLPQEVDIDLGAKRQFSTVNVFTSQNYEIGSYDLDYFDGASWVSLAVVKDNTQQVLTHVFPTVVAQKLRFIVRRGPEAQFIYTRLNEVEIF